MTNNRPHVLIAKVEWMIKPTLRVNWCNNETDRDFQT